MTTATATRKVKNHRTACKRTQQLPTLLRQQCWELLRACWQWCANGCNNSQQCWDLQCIVGRIQPMSLCKACVRSVRGPNNVGRVVQTDPTLLCYVSAITEEKKCWESCTATEMIPTIEMIPATEMIPNHHRNDPVINFRNLGLNGLGTLLSILNSSFIHANTILNRGK